MAQQNIPSSVISHTFSGGMVQDILDDFVKSDFYRYARNATGVLPDGMTGGLSTEPSTIACTNIPYTLIGAIPLNGAEWMLFFTNDIASEIGIFNEDTCKYTTLTGNQPCLGFKRTNLITGASRRGFDCGYDVYWSDGALNFDRFINTAKVPFIQNCTTVAGCVTCVDTTVLDCQKLRLAPVFSVPCLTLAKSQNSGTLLNGSYQVCMAYTINEIKCTDYVALSNVMSVWAHSGQAGAIVLNMSNLETSVFDEMEIVVISMVNGQVQAKRLGLYSTRQTTIYIDNLDTELLTIPLETIPVSTPAIEKSDSISSISNYLLRIGVYTQPDFNYQPLANQIRAWWAAIDYPEDYYQKGGLNGFPMNVGHMRKERYAPFIRWVYNTGEKSASYSIPGLPAGFPGTFSLGGPSVGDGSTTVAHGRFVGYSSTEIYPDDQPEVWGPLCGQHIRLHEFPDAATTFGTGSVPGGANPVLSHYSPSFPTGPGTTSNNIRVMGWYFDNIAPPVDNNGNIIPNIQGYEILRATRNGHEHILAKGMINNLRSYTVPGSTDQGLYQNYPYNDLNADWFLTSDVSLINQGGLGKGGDPLTGVRDDAFSFHSPDTVFEHPFLGSGDLRISMILSGTSTGHFVTPWEHPKFKVLTNLDSVIADIIAAMVTISSVVNAIAGKPVSMQLSSTNDLPISDELGVGSTDILVAGTTVSPGVTGALYYFNVAIAIILAPIQFKIVAQQLLNVIKGLIPPEQFATQYNSYGRYDIPLALQGGAITTSIRDYEYIRGYMQYFAGASVNNLFRNNYVGLQTGTNIPRLSSIGYNEVSRQILSDIGGNTDWRSSGPLYSYYAAYTVPQTAQYGQVDSAKQIPVSCMQQIVPSAGARYTSPIIFGGDTYINRYTEKNPFYYFNDWLKQAPQDIEYDYRNYINVPYPRFWLDNSNVYYDFWSIADKNRRLDGLTYGAGLTSTFPYITFSNPFYVSSGNFYIFNNGCRDFFVESTVNVGYRDWEDMPSKQFYDPYGSSREFIDTMFRSDIINSDILYKYDYSLSANRFVNQYLSWSQCLRRDYDPTLAYTCFAYYPRRIHYSLPQEEEIRRDNWRLFLANNYKNFNNKVTSVKSISKTGAIFLQDDSGPQLLLGVESMPSSSGTDYSVGTGSLFNQQLTSVTNVDDSYQYASSQSRMGVINTPYGIFWVSQRAGKVFQYADSLVDITRNGMHYWFSLYLPSQLLKQFPTYPLGDNPVIGVGCQMVYDTVNEVIYISKKDYKCIRGQFTPPVSGPTPPPVTGRIVFDGTTFRYQDIIHGVDIPISLTDTNYFQDASWTISYSPVEKKFISFHDWHPSYTMGTKNHFISTVPKIGVNTLWRHNLRTDSFCNFYGVDYPFAVEIPVSGQGADTTIESIEYLMEAYNYKANQYDKYNQYDNGMNRMMVVNPEQSTLWMDMQLKPWDNPFATLAFPNISTIGTQNTLYSKVENKYRVGDIRDYTADRGATVQTGSLNITQAIVTDANGYTFNINGLYTNPNKAAQQKKKLRHYNNRVYMQRSIVGSNSMTIRELSVNTTRSFR